MPPPEHRPSIAGASSPSRRRRARSIALVVLAGVGVLFAALNLDKVKVNWVFGTWSTPLIVVIALSILIGAALGLLVGRRRAD